MTIEVRRDKERTMAHVVTVREHRVTADVSVGEGGEDAGPSPHDLYDAALGACKALTMLWYAKRRGLAVEDVHVRIERDSSRERDGVYALTATLEVTGALTEAQRADLLRVAEKCPLHRLMTDVETTIATRWAAVAP